MNMFIYCTRDQLIPLIVLAGLGQLALAAVSLAIPRVLGWKEQTARLGTLTRQVFWTYAGYIFTINVCFGLLSTLHPAWLLTAAPLTTAVDAFIAAYWLARLLLQLFYFDRKSAPIGIAARLADLLLTVAFAGFGVVYTAAALFTEGWRL